MEVVCNVAVINHAVCVCSSVTIVFQGKKREIRRARDDLYVLLTFIYLCELKISSNLLELGAGYIVSSELGSHASS